MILKDKTFPIAMTILRAYKSETLLILQFKHLSLWALNLQQLQVVVYQEKQYNS